jgi:hypothetical protein
MQFGELGRICTDLFGSLISSLLDLVFDLSVRRLYKMTHKVVKHRWHQHLNPVVDHFNLGTVQAQVLTPSLGGRSRQSFYS